MLYNSIARPSENASTSSKTPIFRPKNFNNPTFQENTAQLWNDIRSFENLIPQRKPLTLTRPNTTNTDFSPPCAIPLQKRRSEPVSLTTTLNDIYSMDSIKDANDEGANLKNLACICERPSAIIVCQRCGSELSGRVQQVCKVHPKRICLMDHRECVNSYCRSIHLTEIPLEKK